ncbi:glycoside hydrolase family 88 protein [Umbelopsis sp. PMI_123]|nr:glycoside hydrolase family 88 protein [Umbelopsis sp. PMI_123]
MQVSSSVAYPPKEPSSASTCDQTKKVKNTVFQAALDNSAMFKILKVAKQESPVPNTFPHCTNFGATEYIYEPSHWWTSGFFPGSVWAVCERASKREFPVPFDDLVKLARKWEDGMEKEKNNTNTHDIGFMIMPSFQRDLDLTGNAACKDVIITAANSLLTRWNETVGCFRSWNTTATKQYKFDNKHTDYLVIIDNMMNLDLLYSASLLSGDPKYANLATKHAETTLKNHIRPDWSTYHLIVYDPATGKMKQGLTHQGYDHESTWSRGQAWALYGFATVYKYTKDPKFLDAAKKLTDYFMTRVEDGVVYWDFDAPRPCVWDTSASMIACSGMLLICQLENSQEYIPQVEQMLKVCLERAQTSDDGCTILDHATVNNHPHANLIIADHGLVYADYYFLEVGNRLIDMGLA